MFNEKNSKLNADALANKLKNNGNLGEKDINSFLDENLTGEQARSVKELLKDENKVKAVLQSDAAKALLQKFLGGKNNG